MSLKKSTVEITYNVEIKLEGNGEWEPHSESTSRSKAEELLAILVEGDLSNKRGMARIVVRVLKTESSEELLKCIEF